MGCADIDLKGRTIREVQDEMDEIKKKHRKADFSGAKSASDLNAYVEQVTFFDTVWSKEIIDISPNACRKVDNCGIRGKANAIPG